MIAVRASQVSAVYNLGHVYEAMNRWSSATFLYRSIVAAFPAYIDAWMRLGCIARDLGQAADAKRYYDSAQKYADQAAEGVNGRNNLSVDVTTSRGLMYLKLENLKDSQHLFEKVIQKLDKDDFYSHVALGNIYFAVASDAAKHTGRDESALEKERKYQRHAMMNYRKGFQLSQNKSTIAANGIGAVMAEQGFIREAKIIFQRVRESTGSFPDGWINLAHMYVAEQEFFQAIKLYEKCNSKFYQSCNVQLLSFVSRAQFDWGKSLQEKGKVGAATAKFRECQKIVEKTLHLEPQKHITWFNLAVTKLQTATCVTKQAEPSVADVKAAQGDLQQAKTTLAFLSESAFTEKELGFKKAKAVEHLNACEDKLRDAAAAMDLATGRAETRKVKAERRAEVKNKFEQKLKVEADAKAVAAADVERKRLEMVNSLKDQRQKVIERLATEQSVEAERAEKRAAGGSQGGGGRKRKKDEEENGDEESGAKKVNKKDKKAGSKDHPESIEDLFGSDDSDDDLVLEDEDDEEEDEPTRSKVESGEEEEEEERGRGRTRSTEESRSTDDALAALKAARASDKATTAEDAAKGTAGAKKNDDDGSEDDLDLDLDDSSDDDKPPPGAASAAEQPAATEPAAATDSTPATDATEAGGEKEGNGEGAGEDGDGEDGAVAPAPAKKARVMISDDEDDD